MSFVLNHQKLHLDLIMLYILKDDYRTWLEYDQIALCFGREADLQECLTKPFLLISIRSDE